MAGQLPITSALFGFDPTARLEQQQQADQAMGLNLARTDPFSVPTALGYQAGGQLGRAVSGAFGAQDPQLQEATAIKSFANQLQQEGVNLQSPDGLTRLAQLLAGSGFQRSASLAAQGAQQMQAAQLDAMKTQSEIQKNMREGARTGKVNPSDFTPESLAAFNETGDFKVLVPKAKEKDAQEAADAAVLKSLTDQYGEVAGAKMFDAYKRQDKLRDQEIAIRGQDIDATVAREGQAVTVRGQDMTDQRTREATNAKINEPQTKQVRFAQNTLAILDEIEPLVKTATGSGAGALVDKVQGAFGMSSTSSEAAAQLSALAGRLIMEMPRMEGPQSDKDTQLYREMAGRVGDPSVPRGQKLAAIAAIRKLNQKYAGVTPTGMPPKINDEAAFKALPSGALFVAPDGTTRRKP